jgi:hypothetical protein
LKRPELQWVEENDGDRRREGSALAEGGGAGARGLTQGPEQLPDDEVELPQLSAWAGSHRSCGFAAEQRWRNAAAQRLGTSGALGLEAALVGIGSKEVAGE